ncbi:MAG: hypothetical protein DCC59_00980 [Chloroflexi bacterium]|nr:sulfatase-like hydrolase/transferase [Anaerolineales bacterium]RIK55371.1 MAG: hypothetical protein DCC59_00980 [Chloroflexota bacterium]
MKQNLNRRDFLKLAGLAPLGLIAPPLVKKLSEYNPLQGERKNALVILFDSFSASDISMYGYERETTPNLARLAKRATVFHNHHAGGNYTTPGTASLLTMAHPWSHRAFRFGSQVIEPYANKSVFHAFDDYHRVGYTHNPLANTLLMQFQMDMDQYVPMEKLFISDDGLIRELFSKDEDIATVSWTREIKRSEYGYSYSLLLSHLYEKYKDLQLASYKSAYPNGLPNTNGGNYYVLEEGIDWLRDQIAEFPQPFFAYIHYHPPHFPYKPRIEFNDTFTRDSYKPPAKPDDLFTEDNSYDTLANARARYDEFILNVDSEFGRLFDTLESSGMLENTWVALTSDHGEMQERGISGHVTPTLYQPIVRVPLMIFEPGKATGSEVHEPTSAVDLMTTLLYLTGHEIPEWSEGNILPPYADGAPKRSNLVYTVQARRNNVELPLTEATISQVVDNFKLIYYIGYPELEGLGEKIQLFDIQSDPEEMNDLSVAKRETASELLDLLKIKLNEVNRPYQSG